MLSHFIAFVLVGSVQIATAFWGGIVSVKALPEGESKLKHYGIFLVLGILGLGLTFWVGLQTYQAESEALAGQKQAETNEKKTQGKLDQSLIAQANVQGQLQSMQQILGHVLSNSDPKQTASIWKGIFSSASLQRPAIESMSPKDLQSKIISFANGLRKFVADFDTRQRNQIDQQMAAMRAIPRDDKAKLDQVWNEQNQITANMYTHFALEFKQSYLGTALIYRDELLRRLGPEPIKREMGSRPLALEGWIAPLGVDETATYLERLARTLTE